MAGKQEAMTVAAVTAGAELMPRAGIRPREAGTAPKLMDERMGHEDGSVQSRHDHITAGMPQALKALTEMWEESLNARRAMSPGSPVAVLDTLLKGHQ